MYLYIVDYTERGSWVNQDHQWDLQQPLECTGFQGLLHSNQNCARAFNKEASQKKSALHRAVSKIQSFVSMVG